MRHCSFHFKWIMLLIVILLDKGKRCPCVGCSTKHFLKTLSTVCLHVWLWNRTWFCEWNHTVSCIVVVRREVFVVRSRSKPNEISCGKLLSRVRLNKCNAFHTILFIQLNFVARTSCSFCFVCFLSSSPLSSSVSLSLVTLVTSQLWQWRRTLSS